MTALFLALLLASPLAGQYERALPGYHYEFPRDHFDHPRYETEWWYYNGNLKAADGHRFGYELTFFRQAASRTPRTSDWQVNDVFMAHLALSDIDGRQFLYAERLNRAGPGLAGADLEQLRVWNGNWEVRWQRDTQHLQAIADRFTFQFSLDSLKPPVINGVSGVSQKAAGAGRASHYISLTKLATSGTMTLDDKRYHVEGQSWMDHEFFTHQLDPVQSGWDWLSLQLDDGSELMLYRLRRKDGSVDPYSAGTCVDRRGRSRYLARHDFSLEPDPRQTWTSPITHAIYPIRWRIRVPSLTLVLEATTPLQNQELVSESPLSPNYWEGAIEVEGRESASTVRGVGYLEMTGYDRAVDFGQRSKE